MAASAASMPQSQSGKDYVLVTWERAYALFWSELTLEEEKRIKKYGLENASFEELRQLATIAKETVESSRSAWGARIRKIAELIVSYGAAEDAIISVTPYGQYSTLAIGAIRFLLDTALEESRTAELLTDALDTVTSVIFRAEQYAKLFTAQYSDDTRQIFASLQKKLTLLYSESLKFLTLATVFFKTSTFKRHLYSMLNRFSGTFDPILQQITRKEADVEKDITLLRVEADIQREEFENGIWLPHADSESRLKEIQDQRAAGTSSWFLQNRKYLDWKREGTSFYFLWCSGKAGCGKSTLAAATVADLQTHFRPTLSDPNSRVQTDQNDMFIAKIFCKVGLTNATRTFDILSNFVHQSLSHDASARTCHKLVQKARMQAKTRMVESIDLLWSMTESILREIKRCCYVIDGLDECTDTLSEKTAFVIRICKLFRLHSPRHKLIIFSRQQEPPGTARVEGMVLAVQPKDVSIDIEKYVISKSKDSNVLKDHPSLPQIQRQLIEGAEGVFLWATLMIEGLERDRWNPIKFLKQPPKDLYDIYSVTLQQFASKPTKTANKVLLTLKLVLVAFRPLNIKEILLMVAVEEGLANLEDFDRRSDIDTEGAELISSCGSLLTLNSLDEVNFSHTSVYEFLLQGLGAGQSYLHNIVPDPGFRSSDMNELFALLLVKYMSFSCFNFDSSDPTCVFLNNQIARQQHEHTLYTYGTQYLIPHCCNSDHSLYLLEQLMAFFKTYEGYYWLLAALSASLNGLDWVNRRSRFREWLLSSCQSIKDMKFSYQWDVSIRQEYLRILEESQTPPDFKANWLKILNGQLSIVYALKMYDDQNRLQDFCRLKEAAWVVSQGPDSSAAYRLQAERALYWLQKESNSEDAQKLLETSARGLRGALGTKHKLTLEIEGALYVFYTSSNKKPSKDYLAGQSLAQVGERLERDALEAWDDTNSTAHAIKRANAEQSIRVGRLIEAQSTFESLFDELRDRRGIHDMATQHYWMRRWDILWRMDHKQDAIALLRGQIASQEAIVEPHNPTYLGLVKTLAVALDATGKREDSDMLIREANGKALLSLGARSMEDNRLTYEIPESAITSDFDPNSLPPFWMTERERKSPGGRIAWSSGTQKTKKSKQRSQTAGSNKQKVSTWDSMAEIYDQHSPGSGYFASPTMPSWDPTAEMLKYYSPSARFYTPQSTIGLEPAAEASIMKHPLPQSTLNNSTDFALFPNT